MANLESGSKIVANEKKTGTVVLENGKYYFEMAVAPRKKERVAFGPSVDTAQLKNFVGKKAEAFLAFNGTDLKDSLAAILIKGPRCYFILCYVVPVFKKYFDQLPENTILGFDLEPKAHFIDTLAANKAFSPETAAEMKVAINANRAV